MQFGEEVIYENFYIRVEKNCMMYRDRLRKKKFRLFEIFKHFLNISIEILLQFGEEIMIIYENFYIRVKKNCMMYQDRLRKKKFNLF